MINLQIPALEQRLTAKGDMKTATTLAFRYWQASRFSGPTTDAHTLMQRANHVALTTHRRNPSHLEMYSTAIFIAIEAGHYDNANELLDKAIAHKSFLRTNYPLQYAIMCFLYAYLEIHQNRVRSAKKHWRALTDHIHSAPPSTDYTIMQGLLHLASGEIDDAYDYLREAFREGSNSIFLYEGLYRCYCTAPHNIEGSTILAVLIYAAKRGVDITDLAAHHQNSLFAAISANPEAGEHLYALSSYPPLLKPICTNRITKGDLSKTAYAYYKEAEKKQISVVGLFHALVHAAYVNNADSINHYALSQFLKTAKMDTSLAVYIYHIMLTTPELADLLPQHQNNIILLATTCLENDIIGREAYSLYLYFWSKCLALGATEPSANKAEELLRLNLTDFQLTTPPESAAKYIYITEPEKRGMAVHDITEGDIIISASSQNFSYTCLGVGQRTIVEEKLNIKRMIPGADYKLYRHFFDKGDRRFYLLTYLANYYLKQEEPPDTAIPVFEAVLSEKVITQAYKMRILAALGQIHYNKSNFDQALEYYEKIDLDQLDNDFIAQILNIHIQTNAYAQAVGLIEKKHLHISANILLTAICTLLSKPINHAPLAEAAYRLLIDGNYNAAFLDLVLNHYQASYSEWTTLAQVLNGQRLSNINLDKRILETAIWMAQWDNHAQKSFVQIFIENNDPHLFDQFVEYATYEMLANSAHLEYDTLEILESKCLQDKDIFLTWALASCYLTHNITTPNSNKLLALALDTLESENILFPIFKESRFARIPFIEKYQPFLYHGLPGKKYHLNYRIDNTATFTQVPMQYIKYGMYIATIPLFYNEELSYYFSEEMETGSIQTKEAQIKNVTPFLHDHPTDQFFAINNAITYEQMFKYDQVEKTISALVNDVQHVRSKLL